jgi:hypothetical protein
MNNQTIATIDFSGPFFQVDPGETFLKNLQKMMQGIADEGASAVRQNLSMGSSSRAPVRATGDRVADHVIGRTYARPSKGGRQWDSAAVIQVYDEGMDARTAISLKAAASRVAHQTHGVSRVRSGIRNARAVLVADLTAGME